jgi:hypothetical protein
MASTCAAPGCSAPRSAGYHCANHERVFAPLYRAYKTAPGPRVAMQMRVSLSEDGINTRYTIRIVRLY